MSVSQLIQKVRRLPVRLLRKLILYCRLVWLSIVNRFWKGPVTSPGGPVVSMTTYGRRGASVHFSIESIAAGSTRPSRLILWIDEEDLITKLPKSIRRLQNRGLEVRGCRYLGPHAKYYPYVESQIDFDLPLVTADDDIVYPHSWLEHLVEAYNEYPESVNCYLAHVVQVNEGVIAKYSQFRECRSTVPRFRNLAQGVMGVIYPPSFLNKLKSAGTAFEGCCIKADDLWLHVQALRAGYKVRQIFPRFPYFSFYVIPCTKSGGLAFENLYGDGNDRQIRAVYKDADIQTLQLELQYFQEESRELV